MSNIRQVDFRTIRHRKNGKGLIEDVCGVIEDIDHEVCGYAVFAWKDDGTTASAFKTGGPVSGGGLSNHPSNKVENFMASTIERRR
jgi:hypothetical protein